MQMLFTLLRGPLLRAVLAAWPLWVWLWLRGRLAESIGPDIGEPAARLLGVT